MAETKQVTTPLTDEAVKSLKCGDRVNISGIIYTGRDAAHKIMCEAIEKGEELPSIGMARSSITLVLRLRSPATSSAAADPPRLAVWMRIPR